jgi:hypothetical protein
VSLLSLLALLAAIPALAELGAHQPSQLLPLRDLTTGQWRGGSTSLQQRAIETDEARKKKKEKEEGEGEEAGEPAESTPAIEDLRFATELPPAAPKSPARAFLLSAALPGLGQLYTESNRGYLFLGVEAASWITYASYKSSESDKEDEFFDFANRHFSIEAFEDNCVSQPGQPCTDAVEEIRRFYLTDRTEFYEIISKDPIFRAGWGVENIPAAPEGFVYENGPPPPEGTEEYRVWSSDQAQAQDGDYTDYNDLRNERNGLGETARNMTMVVLINHLASAWDALRAARKFNADLGSQVEMDLKIKASLDNPGARLVFRRDFY